MQPIRTNFKGYEGKYVAIDARTGKIVIADKDPRVVLERPRAVTTSPCAVASRTPMSRSTSALAEPQPLH